MPAKSASASMKTKEAPKELIGEPKNAQEQDTAFAAISYVLGLWIAIIIYIVKKDKFNRFHALQAIIFDIAIMIIDLVVFGVLIALIFVLGIFTAGIGFIPGFLVFYILVFAIGILNFAIRLFLAYKAYKGEMFRMPVIGDLADRE